MLARSSVERDRKIGQPRGFASWFAAVRHFVSLLFSPQLDHKIAEAKTTTKQGSFACCCRLSGARSVVPSVGLDSTAWRQVMRESVQDLMQLQIRVELRLLQLLLLPWQSVSGWHCLSPLRSLISIIIGGCVRQDGSHSGWEDNTLAIRNERIVAIERGVVAGRGAPSASSAGASGRLGEPRGALAGRGTPSVYVCKAWWQPSNNGTLATHALGDRGQRSKRQVTGPNSSTCTAD